MIKSCVFSTLSLIILAAGTKAEAIPKNEKILFSFESAKLNFILNRSSVSADFANAFNFNPVSDPNPVTGIHILSCVDSNGVKTPIASRQPDHLLEGKEPAVSLIAHAEKLGEFVIAFAEGSRLYLWKIRLGPAASSEIVELEDWKMFSLSTTLDTNKVQVELNCRKENRWEVSVTELRGRPKILTKYLQQPNQWKFERDGERQILK